MASGAGEEELRLVNRLGESRSPYVSRQHVDRKLAIASSATALTLPTNDSGPSTCQQSRGMADVGRRESGFGQETQSPAVPEHWICRLSLFVHSTLRQPCFVID